MIKRTLPPLSTHHPPLTPLSRPSLPTAQGLAQAEKPKPAWSGPSQPKSLHGRGDGEATSIRTSCARQRAASLRPLARLARAAGPASWTVRTTAAPPRAAGQPSLKELRCESSESEDERVGVDSSGGTCGRRSALLSRPPSRCPSAGFCAAARIEYCQCPPAARSSHRRNGWFHGRGHESRAWQGVVGDHCGPQPRNWPVGTLLGRARRAGEGQIALAHRAHPYFHKRVLEWARLTVSGK